MSNKTENLKLGEEFLAFIRNDRGCRKKTIDSYRSDLKDLINFFPDKSLLDLNEKEIRNYKYILVEKKLAPRSINRKISCVRSFYDYFIYLDEPVIIKNPAKQIQNMKVPRTIPITFNQQQAETLLNGILFTGRYGVRDYAIFSVFLFTAVRVSELINLKIYDIDFQNNILHVRDGKGAKDRIIPILPRLANALKMYINNGVQYDLSDKKLKTKTKQISKISRLKSGRSFFLSEKEDDQTVFLNKYGEKFSDKGVDYLFKEYVRKLNLYKEGISLHALRRSCLTFLHEQPDVDLWLLKEISGHTRIQTLEHYLAIDKTRVKNAIFKHPLANQGVDLNFVELVNKKNQAALAKNK